MKNNNIIKAKEWFEKGQHDLDGVKDIIDGSGHADVAGVLLQQGIEKYLKGYLISKGWKLKKTHDLKELLDEAVKYNSAFNDYYDLLDIITDYYFEEKYPFSKTGADIEDIKENLKRCDEIVALIKNDFEKKGKE